MGSVALEVGCISQHIRPMFGVYSSCKGATLYVCYTIGSACEAKPVSDATWMAETPEINGWITSRLEAGELSKHGVKSYRHYLRKLLSRMNLTPAQGLEKARVDVNGFWTLAKQVNGFTPISKHQALMALKNWLRYNGIYPPADRLRHPRRVTGHGSLGWGEALAVVSAASKPYNLILKLMLNAGWGISEFLKINSKEQWDRVREGLRQNPNAEYYRFDFEDRKNNPQPFYSLVPVEVLKEILASDVQLPFATRRGNLPFNFDRYNLMVQYLDSAFKTGLRRAPIPPAAGKITVHELRDVFRTRATLTKVAYEAAEFGLGHILDQRGYIKCYRDEPWMWSELRKIYGSVAVTEDHLRRELASKDTQIGELQRQMDELSKHFEPKPSDPNHPEYRWVDERPRDDKIRDFEKAVERVAPLLPYLQVLDLKGGHVTLRNQGDKVAVSVGVGETASRAKRVPRKRVKAKKS